MKRDGATKLISGLEYTFSLIEDSRKMKGVEQAECVASIFLSSYIKTFCLPWLSPWLRSVWRGGGDYVTAYVR